MSENHSETIARLTAYLNQTRRQAEESIDTLNNRYAEIQAELETSRLVCERLVEERDYFKNLSEQLKLENSKKWRLNERDDWKSLVESVQLDRARLQEECTRLEAELLKLQVGNRTIVGVRNSSSDSTHQEKENASSNNAATQSKAERLERELILATQRNHQLELALQNMTTRANASNISIAPSAGTCNTGAVAAAVDTQRTVSFTRTAEGSDQAASRVVQQQRKLAQAGSTAATVWPLSILFGGPAPHERKTRSGILYV